MYYVFYKNGLFQLVIGDMVNSFCQWDVFFGNVGQFFVDQMYLNN